MLGIAIVIASVHATMRAGVSTRAQKLLKSRPWFSLPRDVRQGSFPIRMGVLGSLQYHNTQTLQPGKLLLSCGSLVEYAV